MTARTPGPWYLDADFNVCQDSMQLEPMEIVASHENLTAENATLRDMVAAFVAIHDRPPASVGDRVAYANLVSVARAALAKRSA